MQETTAEQYVVEHGSEIPDQLALFPNCMHTHYVNPNACYMQHTIKLKDALALWYYLLHPRGKLSAK